MTNRPTLDEGPEQWTAADVYKARAEGRDADIRAAQDAGQLRDLMANGDPDRPHGAQSRRGSAVNQIGGAR